MVNCVSRHFVGAGGAGGGGGGCVGLDIIAFTYIHTLQSITVALPPLSLAPNFGPAGES